jgi:beta-glucosidase-like glycosyl hydrolase
MTLQEKIGQLFIAAAASFPQQQEEQLAALMVGAPYNVDHEYVHTMIKEYHVGGLLLLYKSSTLQQIKFINQCQAMATTPLFIFQDCEWGLGMRLYDAVSFPKNMTLGAIENNALLYELGYEIGRQCSVVGVHMNLAPVVDINYNPFNPAIFDRSFGQDKEVVAEKATYIMRGMQAAGILTCAKHFPGQGDVSIDSHVDLPILHHEVERLKSIELHPFKSIIDSGCDAIMMAHVYLPAFEPAHPVPASLSRKLITDLLQYQLGFKGLIITDGMGMEAITKYRDAAHAALDAFMAGNDIILACPDVPVAIHIFEQAVHDGCISLEDLNARVLKILKAKESINLHRHCILDQSNIHIKLHSPNCLALRKRLFQEAITIVQGHAYIPLNTNGSIGLLHIGNAQQDMCVALLARQLNCLAFHASATMTHKEMLDTFNQLRDKSCIVVRISDIHKYAHKKFGISDTTLDLLATLKLAGKKVIAIIFGTPYCLKYFLDCDAIIMAYEDVPETQEAAALVLMGMRRANGKLPIAID